MEFFIAFIGIIYYVSAYLISESKSRKYEISKTNRLAYIDAFKKAYCTSYDERIAMDGYVRRGEHAEEIYKKIGDNLYNIYGKDYKEKFPLPGTRKYLGATPYPTDPAYWATQLLLSKEGKVSDDVLWSGYLIGGYKVKDVAVGVCREIERNLKEKGVPANLVFVPKVWFENKKEVPQWDQLCGNYIKFDFHNPKYSKKLW